MLNKAISRAFRVVLDEAFLQALAEAKKGAIKGEGGPFGAAVIKGNRVIAKAHNTVIRDNDPVAHAEVNVLRLAAKRLKTHDLKGCVLVATSEPCPMCLAAGYWAGVKAIHFALTQQSAAKAGFRDAAIQAELCRPSKRRNLPVVCHREFADEAADAFRLWHSVGGRKY